MNLRARRALERENPGCFVCTKCLNLLPLSEKSCPDKVKPRRCRPCSWRRVDPKPDSIHAKRVAQSVVPDGLRLCHGCGKVKPATQEFFPFWRGKPYTRCRECMNGYCRRYARKKKHASDYRRRLDAEQARINRSIDKQVKAFVFALEKAVQRTFKAVHPYCRLCKQHVDRWYSVGKGKYGVVECVACKATKARVYFQTKIATDPEFRKKRYVRERIRRKRKMRVDAEYRARLNHRKNIKAKHRRKTDPAYAARKNESIKRTAAVRSRAPITGPRFTRMDVFRRDHGLCVYCHTTLRFRGFHVDHVTPLAAGGEHSFENVVASCPDCNMKKAADSLVVFMAKQSMLRAA